MADYRLVDTPELFGDFLDELKRQPRFCIDTETTASIRCGPTLVGCRSWLEGRRGLLPAAARADPDRRVLDPDDVLEALRPILADPDGREGRAEHQVRHARPGPRGSGDRAGRSPIRWSSATCSKAASATTTSTSLSQRLLGHTMIPITDLIGKGKKPGADGPGRGRRGWPSMPARTPTRPGGSRRSWLPRSSRRALEAVRRAGAALDLGAGRDGAGRGRGRRRAARASSRASSPSGWRRSRTRSTGWPERPFNINSGPQLRAGALRRAQAAHAAKDPRRRAEHRAGRPRGAGRQAPAARLALAASPALEAQEHLSRCAAGPGPSRGRAHSRLVQPGRGGDGPAELERPQPAEHPGAHRGGPQIRQAFVARAGLAALDGRLFADRAADPGPLSRTIPPCSRAFDADHDIHSAVAARIFGVAGIGSRRVDAARGQDGEFRRDLWPERLSGWPARLGISQAEAAAFIDAYFQEYAGVDQFITRTLEAALAAGRVETILGRRRPIIGIKNTTGRNRNLAERTAVNTVIQGSAADLIKMAMIKIDRRLREQGLQARMILQIHDELVFEAPEDEIRRPRRSGATRDEHRPGAGGAPEGGPGRRPQLARRRGHRDKWLSKQGRVRIGTRATRSRTHCEPPWQPGWTPNVENPDSRPDPAVIRLLGVARCEFRVASMIASGPCQNPAMVGRVYQLTICRTIPPDNGIHCGHLHPARIAAVPCLHSSLATRHSPLSTRSFSISPPQYTPASGESPGEPVLRIRNGFFVANQRNPIAGGRGMTYKIRERSELIGCRSRRLPVTRFISPPSDLPLRTARDGR